MCSALSAVLDLLRPLIAAFPQPCATQDHEWKKADAGSFVADIDLLLVITIDANSNKTKSIPALVAASIAAGAWWVVLC